LIDFSSSVLDQEAFVSGHFGSWPSNDFRRARFVPLASSIRKRSLEFSATIWPGEQSTVANCGCCFNLTYGANAVCEVRTTSGRTAEVAG
jgi:hypothetical protein